MKPRHKRIALILGGLASFSVATYFVLHALNSNIALFYTPTQVVAGDVPKGRVFRIGGLVEKGSLQRNAMTVHFVVTDTAKNVRVAYTGILPDLFAEGRGVVAQGKLGPGGEFVASEVLAKHDANYMPPDAKSAIEQAQEESKTLKN